MRRLILSSLLLMSCTERPSDETAQFRSNLAMTLNTQMGEDIREAECYEDACYARLAVSNSFPAIFKTKRLLFIFVQNYKFYGTYWAIKEDIRTNTIHFIVSKRNECLFDCSGHQTFGQAELCNEGFCRARGALDDVIR